MERATGGRGGAGRCCGRFPRRGSGHLSFERRCYGTSERVRGCTTGHRGPVKLTEQKETCCLYIVPSPGFDARSNGRNYVRWKADLSFAFGPHQNRRARLGGK